MSLLKGYVLKKISSAKECTYKSGRAELLAGALFLLPSLCGVLIFFLIPFLGSFYYALMDNPVGGHFVGLQNFIDLLHNGPFLSAVINSSLFTAMGVPLIMGISLLLALMIKRAGKSGESMQKFFIFPLVIPVASVALFWQIVFDRSGLLNSLLNICSIGGVGWLETGWSRTVIVVVYLWKYVGYNVVLFLSGLSNIPQEYYESADIDGANSFQKFCHITAIYLTPATFFVFVISIINSLKVFRETYLIAGQYPHESIYMLQHFMNNAFMSLDYQKLTSAAYFMALFISIFVLIFFNYQRKIISRYTK